MRSAIILAWLLLSLSGGVRASDDWTILVSPYLWFAGAEGDLTPIADSPPTGIDVSAYDAIRGMEASSMVLLEASRRKHGALLDIFYSDVLQEHQPGSAGGLSWKASVQETLVTVAYTYEVYLGPNLVIDAIGGLRYWRIGSKVAFNSASGSSQASDTHNARSWVDPVAGVKAKMRLGDSGVYLACFLGGGTGGGADSFYDLTANVGYQVSSSLVASLGYRMFDVDYRDDGFVFDVKQQGRMVGMVWVPGANRLARQGR